MFSNYHLLDLSMKMLCNEKFVDLIRSILIEILELKSMLIKKSGKALKVVLEHKIFNWCTSWLPDTYFLKRRIELNPNQSNPLF